MNMIMVVVMTARGGVLGSAWLGNFEGLFGCFLNRV